MAIMTFNPYGYKAPLALAYGGYNSYRGRTTRNASYTGGPSYTTVSKRRRVKTGKYSSFRTRLLGNADAKHVTTNDTQTTVAGTHNTIYTCNITANVIQGTSDAQRSGDTITTCALKLNGLVNSNAVSTASVQWRIIVGWSGEEYNLPATFSAAGLTQAELFEVGTGGNWRNTGIINPKGFTVLDDRIITLNNSINGVADISEFAYTVPCSAKFPYQTVASVFGKTRNLYVVAIPCILGGATGVTVAGNITLSTDLIFKQI